MLRRSSSQPGRSMRNTSAPKSAPPLFGLAPGGVCRAAAVTGSAVRSYRTLSPLPRLAQGRFALCGTFPEVTFGGRYPPPLFRGARTFLGTCVTRLPGPLAMPDIETAAGLGNPPPSIYLFKGLTRRRRRYFQAFHPATADSARSEHRLPHRSAVPPRTAKAAKPHPFLHRRRHWSNGPG